MRYIRFDSVGGAAGDMILAALGSLGADLKQIEQGLNTAIPGDAFAIEKIPFSDYGMNGAKLEVKITENSGTERALPEIAEIIDNAPMPDAAKKLAHEVFHRLAHAEGEVHGCHAHHVHFHEVGAIDSIADIVSFSVLFDDLHPEKVYFSTLTEGQGFVECQHGKLPVPVPAVCEIASKYELPLKITNNDGEMVTPTGAAIAAALYTGENLPEKFIIEKVGYGAGKRKYENPILRVMKIK